MTARGFALVLAAITVMAPACQSRSASPVAKDVVGEWHLSFPNNWLERPGPRTIKLVLYQDGTFAEADDWRGVETTTGTWGLRSRRNDFEIEFVGQNDNGTAILFRVLVLNRHGAWVLAIDGGPDLGTLAFEHAPK